jgi:hypothetical protein
MPESRIFARVKLARHTTWRQTDRCTDPRSVPLFSEIEKLSGALACSMASQNSGIQWAKACEHVQSAGRFKIVETGGLRTKNPLCPVPSQALKVAERGGFEPPVGFYSYNALAKRRFRPLSHLSGSRLSSKRERPQSARVFGRAIMGQGGESLHRPRRGTESAPYLGNQATA